MKNYRLGKSWSAIGICLIVAAGLLLAACGSSATATPTPTPTAVPTSTPTQSAGGAVTTSVSPTSTPTPTPSFDAAAYFQGKTINLMIGYAPGGSFDALARSFAAVAPKYFPGNPRMVVTNLPGGGGLRAMQSMLMAKPDGLTTVSTHGKWLMAPVLGQDVGYTLSDLRIAGTPTGKLTTSYLCVRRAVASSWQAVLDSGKTLTFGDIAPGGGGIQTVANLIELAGGPIKVIFGYGGGSEIAAALDRGELDSASRCNSLYLADYPDWADKKPTYIIPMAWYGADPANNPDEVAYLARFGLTPQQVPNVFDLPGTGLNDQSKKIANLVGELMPKSIRSFVFPAALPDNVYNQWVSVLEKTSKDPDFVKRADAAGIGDSLALVTGAELQPLLDEAKSLSPQEKALLQQVMPQVQ